MVTNFQFLQLLRFLVHLLREREQKAKVFEIYEESKINLCLNNFGDFTKFSITNELFLIIIFDRHFYILLNRCFLPLIFVLL